MERGVSWTEIGHEGVMQFGIPDALGGGGFNSEFPEGEDSKSFA